MIDSNSKPGLLKLILLSGLLVGTLDITGAFINSNLSFGLTPPWVLKYIATAILGKPAFTGGIMADGLGLLLHYAVAYTWTIFFFFIYTKTNLARQNKYITGIFYGVLIWVIMNIIVVPLTRVPKPKNGINVTQAYINTCILIVAIGIPLSLIAYRYFRKTKAL